MECRSDAGVHEVVLCVLDLAAGFSGGPRPEPDHQGQPRQHVEVFTIDPLPPAVIKVADLGKAPLEDAVDVIRAGRRFRRRQLFQIRLLMAGKVSIED